MYCNKIYIINDIVTQVTTLRKAQLKKLDRKTNLENYRLAAHKKILQNTNSKQKPYLLRHPTAEKEKKKKHLTWTYLRFRLVYRDAFRIAFN